MQALEDYRSEDFGWVVLSFGAGVCALGLLGVVASLDRSKCVLCLVTVTQFLVPLITLALAVIGAGSFALYVKGPVQNSLSSESQCLDENAFSASEDAVSTANKLMCSILCPCDYDASLQHAVTTSGSSKVLVKGSATAITNCQPCEDLQTTLTAQQLPVVEGSLAGMGLTLAQCQAMTAEDLEDRFFSSDERDTFPLLKWAERNFECAGVCTAAPMYLFSDIRKGIPDRACRRSLSDWLQTSLPVYAGITLAIGGWLLLAIGLALALCCVRRVAKPTPPEDVSLSNLACS